MRNPFFIGGLVATPSSAVGAAALQHRRDREENLSPSDRLARASFRGMEGAAGALALAGVGAAAWHFRQPLFRAGTGIGTQVGSWAKNRVLGAVHDAETARGLYQAAGVSRLGSALRAYSSSGTLMVGGGALLGGLIGEHYDHPVAGAATGAAVGFGVKAAAAAGRVWKAAGKYRLRGAAILGLSTMLYYGVQAMTGPQVQGEVYGVPGAGETEYSSTPPSSVRDRMRTLGASGDIAFGLHSQRH